MYCNSNDPADSKLLSADHQRQVGSVRLWRHQIRRYVRFMYLLQNTIHPTPDTFNPQPHQTTTTTTSAKRIFLVYVTSTIYAPWLCSSCYWVPLPPSVCVDNVQRGCESNGLVDNFPCHSLGIAIMALGKAGMQRYSHWVSEWVDTGLWHVLLD